MRGRGSAGWQCFGRGRQRAAPKFRNLRRSGPLERWRVVSSSRTTICPRRLAGFSAWTTFWWLYSLLLYPLFTCTVSPPTGKFMSSRRLNIHAEGTSNAPYSCPRRHHHFLFAQSCMCNRTNVFYISTYSARTLCSSLVVSSPESTASSIYRSPARDRAIPRASRGTLNYHLPPYLIPSR